MPIVFDYIKFNDDFSNLINKLNRNFRLLEDKQGPTGLSGNLGFVGMAAKPGRKGDIGSRGLSDRFIFQTSVNLVSNATTYTFEEYYSLLYENLGVITKTEYDIISALPDLPNDIPESIQTKITEFESIFVDFATREETLNVFLVSQTTSNVFQLTGISYETTVVKLTFANLGTLIDTAILGGGGNSYFAEAPYDENFGITDNVSRSITPNKVEYGVMISNIYSPNPFTISTASRTSNSLPVSTVFDSRKWFNEVVNTYTSDTRLYEHRIISTNYKASGSYSPLIALGNIEVSPIDVNTGLTTAAKELLYKSFYSIGVKEGVEADSTAYELVVMPMTYVAGVEKYLSLFSSGLFLGDKTGSNKVKITTTSSDLVLSSGLTVNGASTVIAASNLLKLQSTATNTPFLKFAYNSSNQYFEIETTNPVSYGISFKGSTQVPLRIKDNTVGFGIEPSALNTARVTASGALLLKEDSDIPTNEADPLTKRIGLFPTRSIVQIGQHSDWSSGANATYSLSMGSNSIATFPFSFVFGKDNSSINGYTFVFGQNNEVASDYSSTIGSYLDNGCFHNHVFGRYNYNYGAPLSWNSTEPLFVVGNGLDDSLRSNALTVLKSGNIEIGSHALPTWSSTPRVAINGKTDSVFLQLKAIDSPDNILRIYQNEIVFSHIATPMPPGNQFNIKNDYGAIHIVPGSSIGTSSSLMLASNGVGVGVNRNPRGKFEVYKSGTNADMLLNSDSTALKFNVDALKSVITSTVVNSTSARELKLAVGTTNAISISTTGNTTVDRTFTASLESFLVAKTMIGSATLINQSSIYDMLHVSRQVTSTNANNGTFIRIDNPAESSAGTNAGIKFGLQLDRGSTYNPQGALYYHGIDTAYGKGEFIFALSSRTSHTLVSADDWKAKLLNNGDFDIKGKYKKNGIITDILGYSKAWGVTGGDAIFYVSAIRYDSYTLITINVSLPPGCDNTFENATDVDGVAKFLNDNGLLPAVDERISGISSTNALSPGTPNIGCSIKRQDILGTPQKLDISVKNASSLRENITLSFRMYTP